VTAGVGYVFLAIDSRTHELSRPYIISNVNIEIDTASGNYSDVIITPSSDVPEDATLLTFYDCFFIEIHVKFDFTGNTNHIGPFDINSARCTLEIDLVECGDAAISNCIELVDIYGKIHSRLDINNSYVVLYTDASDSASHDRIGACDRSKVRCMDDSILTVSFLEHGPKGIVNMMGGFIMNDSDVSDMLSAGSGESSSRPSLGSNPSSVPFFDTDIGKPVWWNGADWIDASGNVV
jgi:hypothetical protein